ncbi:MAG: hypothetical protein IKG18_07235 [Atopobiaceae bacterium]|nr:hypothetical protein [Atopobiaceae bacterium]
MPLDEITSSTLSPRCMRCMLDKYLDSCPANTPCRTRSDYMRRVLRTVAEGSESLTAPEIGHELRLILRDMFGIERDFTQIKQHFNELVLGLKSQLTERMASSDATLVDARQIGLNSSLSTLTTSRFTPSLTLAHRRSYPLARMRSARVTCGLR